VTDQNITFAGDAVEVVVRDVSPFLLDLSGELFPVALYLISVHLT
jgi:hypothetical protein